MICSNCLKFCLIFILLVPLLVFGEPRNLLEVNEPAPNLILRDLQDKEQIFPCPGKWNIVFFWSLFCHTCIEEIPVISNEISDLKDRPVSFFFVSLDTVKLKKAVENFLKKRNLVLNVLLEEIASDSYKSADQWGVKTTPSAFLINPEGKIAFSREGPFDPEEMLSILRTALASGSSNLVPK